MSYDLRLAVAKSIEQLRAISDDLQRPAPPTREYEVRVSRRLGKIVAELEDVLNRTDPMRRNG